jgi:hypothetical protein
MPPVLSTASFLPGHPDQRPRRELAPCIQAALASLGTRYAREGVRLFLFGSIARFWPEAPLGADFDIGYETPGGASDPDGLRRRLEDDLETLPSIRPVDLVDFSRAPEPFRSLASQCRIDLSRVPASPAAR